MTSAMPDIKWLPGRIRQELGYQSDPQAVEAHHHLMRLGPFKNSSMPPSKSRKRRRSKARGHSKR